MQTWVVIEVLGLFYARLMSVNGDFAVRTHPIAFETRRDADRAVARLNAREAEQYA